MVLRFGTRREGLAAEEKGVEILLVDSNYYRSPVDSVTERPRSMASHHGTCFQVGLPNPHTQEGVVGFGSLCYETRVYCEGLNSYQALLSHIGRVAVIVMHAWNMPQSDIGNYLLRP